MRTIEGNISIVNSSEDYIAMQCDLQHVMIRALYSISNKSMEVSAFPVLTGDDYKGLDNGDRFFIEFEIAKSEYENIDLLQAITIINDLNEGCSFEYDDHSNDMSFNWNGNSAVMSMFLDNPDEIVIRYKNDTVSAGQSLIKIDDLDVYQIQSHLNNVTVDGVARYDIDYHLIEGGN